MFSRTRASGGTVFGGPTDPAKRPRLGTGPWSRASVAPNMDGVTSSAGPLNLFGAQVATGAGMHNDEASGANWFDTQKRTVKALENGLQNEVYNYHPLFMIRTFPESKKNVRVVGANVWNQDGQAEHNQWDIQPHPSLSGNRVVTLDEIRTLAGCNYHIYKLQEAVYLRYGSNKSAVGRQKIQEALDDLEHYILRTVAFCGVGKDEKRLGLRPNERTPRPTAAAQKEIMTTTQGHVRQVFNVWGASPAANTSLFFILKRVEDAHLPDSYTYTSDREERIRSSISGDLLVHERLRHAGLADPPRFCPFQFIPYARSGADTPSLAARSYVPLSGKGERYGKWIKVGRFKQTIEQSKAVPAYIADNDPNMYNILHSNQLAYDTAATMAHAQCTIHLNIKHPVQPLDKPENMVYRGPPSEDETARWQSHHT